MSAHDEGRGERARVGDKAAVGSKGVDHREGCGGLECWGRMWCVEVYQETAGIVTRAPEQHEQVTKGHTPRRGGAGYRG